MKLSIISTLYQSSEHIDEFYLRTTKAAQELVSDDYEIILVNDGSPDDSLRKAVLLTEKDSHVTVIDLSRNFGHHKAIMAGLAHTKGDRIFLLDSDLEEEPEWLHMFSQEMEKTNSDVVFGYQPSRKGSLFERFSGWLFFKIFISLTDLEVQKNVITTRLMTRRYLNALLLHKEREISLVGLFALSGFDQVAIKIKKHNTSASAYSFKLKMILMVNSITSFSNKPLVGIFYVGFLILALSSINIVYLLLNWLIFSTPLSGWTSVMASIWFLGGLIVLFIGIIGIYISKVFSETKQRPNTITKQIYTKRDL